MELNPQSIALHFIELVKAEFPLREPAPAGEAEVLISKELLEHLFTILTDCVINYDVELVDGTQSSSSQSQGCSESSSWSQDHLRDDHGNDLHMNVSDGIGLERKNEILQLVQAHPTWNIQTIQRKGGPEYKHKSYYKRWERHIFSGGTLWEKYSKIDEQTFEMYKTARNEFKAIHEDDLCSWAIQTAQTFNDPNFIFKASRHWLFNFKTRHGICSRRITQLINKRQIKSPDEILATARKFQLDFQECAKKFDPDDIFNTDQCGFNYELVSNRTLSNKGEKLTFGFARSPTNLVSHSYTVQYVISCSGRIIGDVFLCLQEKSGRLGPKVQENLFPAANVSVTCSSSGKLTTSLFEYFLDEVLIESAQRDFLFLIDSWGGQTNPLIYSERFGGNEKLNCTCKIIPEKCTAYCQPLDTTFHRQLKYFAKQIYNYATLHKAGPLHKDDEITTRNNIIRMHSLIHNQLSAPIFNDLIKYAWYSAGLTTKNTLFLTVKQVCFTFSLV